MLASLPAAWGTSGDEFGQRTACDGGAGEACRLLAEAYLSGDDMEADRVAAIDLYGRGCEHGDAESCLVLAHGYHRGEGLPMDLARSAEYHGMACELGEPDACRQVADLHTAGSLGTPDPVAAQVWYRLGCDLGDPPSCTSAAMGMERGDSGDVSDTAPLELLQRACTGGHAEGCVRLGARVRDRQRDKSAALEWFDRGCELDNVVSCREVGVARWRGRHVDKDLPKAVLALSMACAGDDRVACLNLALVHRRSQPTRAHEAAARGCSLGSAKSCRLTKRLAPDEVVVP